MWMYVVLYSTYRRGARTAADKMCVVARYYDISSKADRRDIFIIHDQKSPCRTPLVGRENVLLNQLVESLQV